MAAKKWYIGRRGNPQLPKPYFVAYGQLSVRAAEEKETCLYGSMSLTGYASKEEFESNIKELEASGYRVSRR